LLSKKSKKMPKKQAKAKDAAASPVQKESAETGP
jgi:hypothetical protein